MFTIRRGLFSMYNYFNYLSFYKTITTDNELNLYKCNNLKISWLSKSTTKFHFCQSFLEI